MYLYIDLTSCGVFGSKIIFFTFNMFKFSVFCVVKGDI